MREWSNLAGLLRPAADGARAALIGAPVGLGSVTPGECHRAPGVLRKAMKRIGTYDVETEAEIETLIYDAGDAEIAELTPAEMFAPLRAAIASLVEAFEITVVIGDNNAITRPGVRALGDDLSRIGLITLDAHFDMRDTSAGLSNGNPVQALLDDGLPGANIAQIGLAPFANAKYMHEAAKQAGNRIYTMAECRHRGVTAIMREALEGLAMRCDRIYVDFDIDVIERGMSPGAPGGRPGGMSSEDFFAAARLAGAHSKVRAVDLAEFDPSQDVSDITALIGARWVAEILAGFESR